MRILRKLRSYLALGIGIVFTTTNGFVDLSDAALFADLHSNNSLYDMLLFVLHFTNFLTDASEFIYF